MTTRSKFQNVKLAYIKQSNSRDVSEGLDDTTVLIMQGPLCWIQQQFLIFILPALVH